MYSPDSLPLKIYAGTSCTLFGDSSSHNYSHHFISGEYEFSLDKNAINSISIQTALAGRLDKVTYNEYDYLQALAGLSYQHLLSETSSIEGGYELRWRNYSNNSLLTYLENSIFGEYKISFDFGTSIGGRVLFGLKNYSNSLSDTVATASGNAVIPRIITPVHPIVIPNAGRRKLNGKALRDLLKKRQQNKNTVPTVVYDSPSASKIEFSIDIGQSITENTGLSLSYSQKWLLDDYSKVYIGGNVDHYSDDELFDDPYSHTSQELSFGIKQLLPFEMILTLSTDYASKNYVYSLDTVVAAKLRKDDYYVIGASLEKNFELDFSIFQELSLSLDYYYFKNSSNTSLFKYSNSSINFSATISF